jgi:hypothetical protein
MLNQNIYIIYPAGYMGTYINWMLSVSEKQQNANTVLNPLTESTTAHNHLKIPTHLGWAGLLTWIAYNRPTNNRIYALNCSRHSDYHLTPEYAIQNIMRIDDNPVFINCHDSGDLDQMKFGTLNMFTKWPTFVSAMLVWQHNKYNPATDFDTIRARNWLLDHWTELNPGNLPINPDIVLYNLKGHRNWYNIRKETAPLEITPDQYLIPAMMSESLLDVSLHDIVSPEFPSKIQSWVESIELGDWNFDHAINYHSIYVTAQDNLKWFDSITQFRTSRTVNPWLLKNAMSQAFLLMEFPREEIEPLLENPIEIILEKML